MISSSNLDLYGALKRFSEWHHARVSLVNVEQEVTGCEPWIESVAAEMYNLRDGGPRMENNVLWRGSIKLKSAQVILTIFLFYKMKKILTE